MEAAFAPAGFPRTRRLLLGEDNPHISDLLRQALERDGWTVHPAVDTASVSRILQAHPFDVILLEPSLYGTELSVYIRNTPVVLIPTQTAASGWMHRLLPPLDACGLSGTSPRDLLQTGSIIMDRRTGYVTRNGEAISLTRREFRLLELLMQNPQRVLSRQEISASLWGKAYDKHHNVIDVTIRHLRRKLDGPLAGAGNSLIQTVRGAGYILRAKA